LSKEDRDELIRRLVAAGHKQKDVAEAVGLDQSRISRIARNADEICETHKSPISQSPDLTTTAKLKDDLAAAGPRG
jgi:transcriptional regulator with XRE-family HTH domain